MTKDNGFIPKIIELHIQIDIHYLVLESERIQLIIYIL